MISRISLALLALTLHAQGASSATPSPIPALSIHGPIDLDALLQATRLRESMTARLIYSYTFRQTTIDEALDEQGRVTRKHVRTYQVVPTPTGTERHLISEDGEPPSPGDVRKQERRNEKVKARIEKT